ncbi:MAG: hypothetical protein KDD63_10375, partial [Bacteroidetes bacterium]|nr:hypothetical protein [Bacteroidota bacterium]
MQYFNSLAFKNAIVYFVLFLFGFSLLSILLLYYSSKEIIQGEERSIFQAGELVDLKIQEQISELKQDIKFLSQGPLLKHYFETRNPEILSQIESEFLALLNAKPDYDQIRFISETLNGRELIRVERKDNQSYIVADSLLQNKGNRDYYKEAIVLPKDGLYLSPIDLNREYGKISDPITPTLRAAYPVYFNDKSQGIVIVNMDLTSLFVSLNQIVGNNAKLRLINPDGYYIFHENRDSTFLFEYGKPPNLTHIPSSTTPFSQNNSLYCGRDISFSDGSYYIKAMIITDKDVLLANYYKWRRSSLAWITTLAVLLMLLSFVILRRQSAKLKTITANLATFPSTLETENLPIDRKDEIGQLAQSFYTMAGIIKANIKSLNDAKTVAQDAVTEKEKFIENFSHEIRNPLQSIIGLSHVLEQNNPSQAQLDILRSMQFNADNLNILIN